MKSFALMSVLAIFAAAAAGCAQSGNDTAGQKTTPVSGAYVLANQPPGAKGVAEVRESAKDGDEVVVAGRVGGDAEPFVEGAAAFTIIDPALEPCSAAEGCPTPWDYCCDVDMAAANKAMVKVVDKQGRTVTTDARKLLNVQPLAQVVVHGRAKRDDAGNLTVLADGVYVSK